VNRVTVHLAPLLHSYTRGAREVGASGATLGEALDDLDRRFPGIRFRIVDEQNRIRRHMRFFVNGADVPDISAKLTDGDQVHIIGALSGG
jgi:molybdopterin synthase sulfur carrier subunit